MNPSTVNPTKLFTNSVPAARNAAPVAPEAAFNQVLNREIADRKPANNPGNASNAPAREAAQAKQPEKPGQATKTADAQSGKATEGTGKSASKEQDQQDGTDAAAADAADAADAVNAAAGMLALVANAVQVNAPVDPAVAALASRAVDASGLSADGKARHALTAANAAALSAEQPLAELEAGGTKPDPADFAARIADAAAGKGQSQKAAVDGLDLRAAPQVAALAANGAASAPDAQANPLNTALTAQQNMNALQTANGLSADKLTPRVGTSAWDQAVGQKVVWMAAGAQQSATLTLNPPDLGPLQIVLNVNKSDATATFIAAQPEVRQALEAAMPKLREMLGDAGIQLGQANVSAGTPNQGNAFGEQPQSGTRQIDAGATDGEQETGAAQIGGRSISSGQGMVDTFA